MIGDELVISLQILIADIEKDGAVFALRALLENTDRQLVPPEQRRKQRGNEWLLQNFRKRLAGEQRNQIWYELIRSRLDHHRQFHCGRFHLHGGLGIGIEGAIDNVGPVDEVGHRGGIEAEALLRDHGDKAGAGLEARIVELAVALVLFKVGGIGRREKRAFVMIEPPGKLRRTGILEIDDGVFVAIELDVLEQRPGAMQQPGEGEFGVGANALAVKAGKQCGRGCAVETFVVIKNLNSQ